MSEVKEIKIVFIDEMSESEIEGSAVLNLETGEITARKYDIQQRQQPSSRKDYECSYGRIELDSKDIEFSITVDNGSYFVNNEELSQVNTKMKTKKVEKIPLKKI